MFNTLITIYVQIQYLHVRKICSEESESMATTGAWCSGRLLSSTTLSYGGSTVGETQTLSLIFWRTKWNLCLPLLIYDNYNTSYTTSTKQSCWHLCLCSCVLCVGGKFSTCRKSLVWPGDPMTVSQADAGLWEGRMLPLHQRGRQ